MSNLISQQLYLGMFITTFITKIKKKSILSTSILKLNNFKCLSHNITHLKNPNGRILLSVNFTLRVELFKLYNYLQSLQLQRNELNY